MPASHDGPLKLTLFKSQLDIVVSVKSPKRKSKSSLIIGPAHNMRVNKLQLAIHYTITRLVSSSPI